MGSRDIALECIVAFSPRNGGGTVHVAFPSSQLGVACGKQWWCLLVGQPLEQQVSLLCSSYRLEPGGGGEPADVWAVESQEGWDLPTSLGHFWAGA